MPVFAGRNVGGWAGHCKGQVGGPLQRPNEKMAGQVGGPLRRPSGRPIAKAPMGGKLENCKKMATTMKTKLLLLLLPPPPPPPLPLLLEN